MPDFSKVRPGQKLRINAGTWNQIVQTVQQTQENLPLFGGSALQAWQQASNTVLIKNDSGSDVQRFGVLGIGGVVIDPSDGPAKELSFAEKPVLRGVTPTTSSHADRFVVCLEPIKNQSIGTAAVGGVFACKVSMTSTSHKFAGVKNNDATQLESKSCGLVQLLWVQTNGPSGAGPTGPNKWAVAVM